MSDFKWNNEKKTFELVDVGLIQVAKNNIAQYDLSKLVIQDEADYKKVYEARTKINNLVKDLSTKRKQMEAIVVSGFKPQCIEVEKYASEISNAMTENLNAFKPKQKAKTSFQITIKTDDPKVIKKFETMALKYGCQIITKEV